MPNLLNYAAVRIGKVEIWQDGNIAERDRMLLPCKRLSDNVLGMYDVVRNEFLTNVGTGTFVAGAEALGCVDDVLPPSYERFHLGRTESKPDWLFAGLGDKYTDGMSYSANVGNNWATMVARTGFNDNNEPCGWFAVNATDDRPLTNIGTFRADNSTFGLFGRLSKNDDLKTYSAHRVMYMDVKEGNDQILTHRLVPCRRVADGELGVYDTVTRQFLYDTGREARGADVFLAGPVVGDGRRTGLIIYVR